MNKWFVGLTVFSAALLVFGACLEFEVAVLFALGVGALLSVTEAVVSRLSMLTPARLLVIWGAIAASMWGVCAVRAGTLSTLWFQGYSPDTWLAVLLMLVVLAVWGLVVVLWVSWPTLGPKGGGLGLATAALICVVFVSQVVAAYTLTDDLIRMDWSPILRYTGTGYDEDDVPLGARSAVPIDLGGSWLDGDVDDNARGGRLTGLFERVADAVVMIMVNDELYATGFIVRPDGLALTAWHVVDSEGPFVARFRDGSERGVRVLRWNAKSDVALLQINCGDDCPWVPVDRGSTLVGTDVIVVGNPYHETLNHTVTQGIVSGVRTVDGVKYVQTDAAINGGNSGGPVIDVRTGRVIGIVSWGINYSEPGLSFAIAMDHAIDVLVFEEGS